MIDVQTGCMRPRSLIPVALLVIPVILVLAWHLCNRGLPTGDTADYAETALLTARQFHEHGIVAGIAAMLDARGWRPTMFPVLAVPAFLLTGNDLLAGPAVTLLLVYVALILYLYQLALLWSDPLVAAAACCAVLSMPAVVTYSLIFFSESAWLLFSIACLYHLLRSGPFGTTGHAATAGTFAALMIAVRPVESVIVLGGLLPFLVIPAIHAKTFLRGNNLIAFGLCSAPAVLLLMSMRIEEIPRLMIWGVCLGAVVLGVCLADRYGRPLVGSVGALVSLSCVWWAGFMPALYRWFQFTRAYNKTAKVTTMASPAEIAQAFWKQARDYGELQLAVLFCLAIYLMGSAALRAWRKPPEDDARRAAIGPARLLLYGASILLAVFAALYSSGGSDRRRGLVALVLFGAPAITLAARRSRIVLAAVFGLIVVQCGVLASAISRSPAPAWMLENTAGIPWPHPVDTNFDTARVLAQYVPSGSSVAVYTTSLFGGPRVYEPNALRLLCLREEIGFSVNSANVVGTYSEVVQGIRDANYKYLLLDSLEEVVPVAVHEPHVLFTKELLRRTRAGDTPGLSVISRFQLGEREHILFRIQPRTAPPANAANVAAAWTGSRAIATSQQKGYLVANLIDGTDAPWGSSDGTGDLYAGVVLAAPHAIRELRLRLFTPPGRPHIRDIRIVAADAEGPNGPNWEFLRARLKGSPAFGAVITVPALPDGSVVTVEVDRDDPKWRSRSIWGFACLRSQGDVPNYIGGTAVYVRELEMQ